MSAGWAWMSMTPYSLLRLVHSYWRWVVFVSALVVLVRAIVGVHRSSDWTRGDERALGGFVSALDFQVLIGVILYFAFSPFWLATYQSFHATMSSPVARFFGIEHETAMLLAFIAAHAGRVRARRALAGVDKHRAIRTALVIFFALLLWPFPGRGGRSGVRFSARFSRSASQ